MAEDRADVGDVDPRAEGFSVSTNESIAPAPASIVYSPAVTAAAPTTSTAAPGSLAKPMINSNTPMTVGPQSPARSPRSLKESSQPPRFRLVPLETSETSTNESVVRAELLLAWDKSAVPAVVRVRSFDPSSQVITSSVVVRPLSRRHFPSALPRPWSVDHRAKLNGRSEAPSPQARRELGPQPATASVVKSLLQRADQDDEEQLSWVRLIVHVQQCCLENTSNNKLLSNDIGNLRKIAHADAKLCSIFSPELSDHFPNK